MPSRSDALERLQAAAFEHFADHALALLASSEHWQILPTQVHTQDTAWQPDAPFVIIDGDLTVSGNAVISVDRHDHGVLIVLGDVHCRQLITGFDHHLLVRGHLTATEAVVAELGDSTTCVEGAIRTHTLLSGRGAWLALASPDGYQAEYCTNYVMAGDQPLHPTHLASPHQCLDDAVLDRAEWDDMDATDRQQEDIDDYIVLDEAAALQHLLAGGTLRRG